MKKILVDGTAIRLQLQESATGGQPIARGEFGRCDVPTENRRIYPRALWEREIKRIQKAIQEGKVLGEIDHPSDGKTSLKRVSHVITSLHITDDGQVIGEAKILDNEHGRQLASILKAGGCVGVSSRGMGSTSLSEDGFEIVQEDYQYMTHDFVANPAVTTSYPEFKLESKEVKGTIEPAEMNADATSKEAANAALENAALSATADGGEVISGVVPVAEGVESTTNEVIQTESKAAEEAEEEEKAEEKAQGEEAAQEAEPAAEMAAEEEATEKQGEAMECKCKCKCKPSKDAPAEEVEESSDSMASVILSEIARIVSPFKAEADVAAKIAEFETRLAESDAKLKSALEESEAHKASAIHAAKVAKEIGLHLHLETAVRGTPHEKVIRELIGDVTKFENHEHLVRAVSEAKEHFAKLNEQTAQDGAAKSQEVDTLKKQIGEMREALAEATALAKKHALKSYVVESVKGNANAAKIVQLAESVATKEEADALISRHSVEPSSSREYNSIRNRFSRMKGTKLVEEQVRVTGTKPVTEAPSQFGVDRELVDLIGFTSEQLIEL